MPFRLRPLAWLPPATTKYVYTVLLRPAPLRAAAQSVVKRFIPEVLDFRGVRLALNPADAVVSGSLALGCYEQFEVRVFETFLRPGLAVYDVGANIGLYTAIAARRVAPGGSVVAVEPDGTNCDFIRRTVELNGFSNVRVFRKAVGEHTGAAQLFLCPDNKADHRVFTSGASVQREAVPVPMTTLDDLIDAERLSPPDVMKIDIQGSEHHAWNGMSRTLERQRDLVIFMELWPWGIQHCGGNTTDLLRSAREMGFRIYELDGDNEAIVAVTDDAALAARGLERQHANLLLSRNAIDGRAVIERARRAKDDQFPTPAARNGGAGSKPR
jgi:FkbM family methyltransferase